MCLIAAGCQRALAASTPSHPVTTLQTVMTHILQIMEHWPWATIAAFTAAAIALWTALSGVRERRQQLRQSAVLEVWRRNYQWNAAAGDVLPMIRQFLAGAVAADVIDTEGLKTVSDATISMDISLESSHDDLHRFLTASPKC
jgi:hypothetical protein